jgi:hypothetical protein
VTAKLLMKIVLLGAMASTVLYMYYKQLDILYVQCAVALLFVAGNARLLVKMYRPEAQKALARAIIPRSISRGRLL